MDVAAPIVACGEATLANATTLYHYSTRRADIRIEVVVGRLLVESEYSNAKGNPTIDVYPLKPGTTAHLLERSFATAALPAGTKVRPVEPRMVEGGCDDFAEIGAPPTMVFGKPRPRTIDPWRMIPAVPEESFFVVPQRAAWLAGAFDFSVHHGNVSLQSPDSIPTTRQAGVLESPQVFVDDRQFPASPRFEMPPVKRILHFEIENGELVFEPVAYDRTRSFWDGEKEAQDPRGFMPGRYFPRSASHVFPQRMDEYAMPYSSIASDDMVLRGTFTWDNGRFRAEKASLTMLGHTNDARRVEFMVQPQGGASALPDFGRGVAEMPPQAFAILGAATVIGASLLATARRLPAGLAWLLPARLLKGAETHHPVRAHILDIVRETPGIGQLGLCKRLGSSWGTTLYHLQVLERTGHIVSLKEGRTRRVFPADFADSLRSPVSLLRNAAVRRVLDEILSNPTVTQQEIAVKVGCTSSTINWHVARLDSLGLVQRRRAGRHVRYEATPLGQRIAAHWKTGLHRAHT